MNEIQMGLIECFNTMCSSEQIDLCGKLNLLNKSEQQQAFKMAKALTEHHQLPVHAEDWQSLKAWVEELRDRYAGQIEQQSIRVLQNESERAQRFDQMAGLSARLEGYGLAHDDLTDLLSALKGLRNDWKHRKRDVENIVLSILSASNQHRVVKITRAHLHSLGLGLASIGHHYILFEADLAEDDRKQRLQQIAHDFSQVFQENAAQNIARMAGSYHRVFDQPVAQETLMKDIQQLSHAVYAQRRPVSSTVLSYPTSLPDPTAAHTFRDRRKSIVIVAKDHEPVLFNMAPPLFSPAGWDWPHILKYKKPNGLWSSSVTRLAQHFNQIGLDYYTNMLNNARLMHAHRTQMFEFATHSLIKIYRALQLEQGFSNLIYALRLIQQLQEHSKQARL
ncbi:hypothetical protein BY458DRAFT_443013 [Sporodiniella umbellata]|nr:hypothetical protein BY458DRAFT_443013 [Sporodiniella umbellata]